MVTTGVVVAAELLSPRGALPSTRRRLGNGRHRRQRRPTSTTSSKTAVPLVLGVVVSEGAGAVREFEDGTVDVVWGVAVAVAVAVAGSRPTTVFIVIVVAAR